MSFQGLTPESLLDRADSKNPATTCKGLTVAGRPCRRGLASTPGSSPNSTPTKVSDNGNVDELGVVAIMDSSNAAAFFCWQHKDQAQNLITQVESQQARQQQQPATRRQGTRIIPLHQRSSIDTLIEKVGIIDLDGDASDQLETRGQNRTLNDQRRNNGTNRVKVSKRDKLPVEWQKIHGPLMSVPEDVINEVALETRPPKRQSRSRSRTRLDPGESRLEKLEISSTKVKPKVKASWSCCGFRGDVYNDDGPPVRRRERHDGRQHSRSQSRPRQSTNMPRPISSGPAMAQNTSRRPSYVCDPTQDRARSLPTQTNLPSPTRIPAPNSASRPDANNPSIPQQTHTSQLLSLIPTHLNPQTTSALLVELSKPFAKGDDAGYIYIYWLTPSSSPDTPTNNDPDKPDDDLASTILDSDTDSDPDTKNSSYHPSHRHKSAQATGRKAMIQRYAGVKVPNSRPGTNTNKPPPSPPTILLKIGRATNVHRRMTQWSKQCGQNITLVRYYPRPRRSSSPSSPSAQAASGMKVPHVNRVERLIHIELRGRGMGVDGTDRKCGACGRGHREWFEVGADREGVRIVDEVVGRWVGWGLRCLD